MLQKHISQYTDEELEAWIQHLVDDEVAESMTLEYKSEAPFSKTLKLEIAKDISSFANTKGGVIIYGIPERHVSDGTEKKAIPCSDYGTEPVPNFESRLEDILTETISPHLPDLWIREVPISQKPGHVVYVVWHPESWLGPHMVQGYNEQRYYKRGLRRTIKMSEPEVRDAYTRVQRGIEIAEQFLDSSEINYIRKFFPPNISVSQAVICPQLLVGDRVNYSSADMREWLRSNSYPQSRLTGGATFFWYPSLHGAQIVMKQEVPYPTTARPEAVIYWVELHRNGTVNALWQTHVRERNNNPHLLFWVNEVGVLSDFISFTKNLYTKICYYGPFRFRFSISNLDRVEFKPSEADKSKVAQLPGGMFKADLVEDSARLFENPKVILQSLADCLFQAFGEWKAPTQTL